MLQRIAALLRFQPPVVDTRGLLYGSGADYPTLGDDGWQTGAIWANTDGSTGTSLYVNEGSVTSCNFVPIDTAAGASAGAIEFDDNTTGPLISIETTTPTNLSYTTPFLITGAYSGSCGHALVLSATNQRPVSFLFEDGSAVLGAGNYRGVLSRVLLCSTQTGQIAIRAIRGQVKPGDGLTLNIGANEFNLIAGVEGYMELAGATLRTIGANTRVAALAALLEINQDITLTAGGKCVGVLVQLAQTTAKTVDGIGTCGVAVGRVDSDHATHQADWDTGFVTGDSDCTLGMMLGAATGGITFSGLISDQVIKYATTTSVGDTTAGHLIQYGTSASAIIYTPTVGGSHSGIQMYITSADCLGGLGMVGVRVRVELTGTSNATINAGQFWAKINCTDYTGHYLGGHPTGLSGIIECVGTARTAASVYAVMAGVCGEVRPISGTVDAGGTICGLHAKVFGTSAQVATGDVVGVLVQSIGSGAADIGVLIQPHPGAGWTTGIKIDSGYAAVGTGISVGNCSTAGITVESDDDKVAGYNAIYSHIDTGGVTGWNAGRVTASRFKVTLDGSGNVGNVSAIWGGLNSGGTYTGLGQATCAAFEVVTTHVGSHPTAILYLTSAPGTSASHATMPYLVFAENPTGTGSNILFEVGSAPAGYTCTTGAGNLYHAETLQIKVNGNARYLLMSTAQTSFTTAYQIILTTTDPATATNGIYSNLVETATWTGSITPLRCRNTITTVGAGGNCYGGWFNMLFDTASAPTGLGLSCGLYVEAGSNVASTGVSSVLMATLLGDADGAITASPILTLADASTLKTAVVIEFGFNAGGTLLGTAADVTTVAFRTGGNAATNIQFKQGLRVMCNGAYYYMGLIAEGDWQND